MHRRFRICATIALIGFGTGRGNVAAQQDAPPPLTAPTPGKHQLRASPLEVVQHLLDQQNERIAAQGRLIEGLSEKIDAQNQRIEKLLTQGENNATELATLHGHIIALGEQVEVAAAARRQNVVSEPVEIIGTEGAPSVSTTPPTVDTGSTPFLTQQALAQNGGQQATTPPLSGDLTEGGNVAGDSETVPGGRIHTVAQGETLTDIARRYNTSVAELTKLNQIKDARRLQIGQTLFIP